MDLKDQRGYTFIIVLLVIVVGAFFFAGGMRVTTNSILTQYEQPTAAPQPTTAIPADGSTPAPTQSAANPTPTTTQNSWSITFHPTDCIEENVRVGTGIVTARGTESGYITVEVEDNGVWNTVADGVFAPETTTLQLTMPATDGFGDNNWRINLFSGGTNNSGGTLQANSQQDPTGCS